MALNPDVSFDNDTSDGNAHVTVAAPTAASPTYIAFVLPYSNNGSATVPQVVLKDRVPEGTSIYQSDGATYNGSVLINKKPGKVASGGNVEITDNGRTLLFHVGDLAPGANGFVVYKVRVLGPGESGAPSVDTVLSTSGSVLSSPFLSHDYIGQPDGDDITVVGRYNYYLESTQYTSNTADLSQGITYEIYYQNTGTRKSKILEIDDPIPAGTQYVGCELLDGNHQSLPGIGIPAGAVDVPTDPANGTLVFHPPAFTGSGKVKPGDSGFIRVFFLPLGDGRRVFTHTPSIPGSSFGTASAVRPGGTRARVEALLGAVTRAAGSDAKVTSSNRTRADDSSLAKSFVTLATPMVMVEGQTSEIFVGAGSLSDTPLNVSNAGFLTVTLPKGVQFVSSFDLGTDLASYRTATTSDGLTQVLIDFPNGLTAHGAAVAKFLVRPQTGAAGTAVAFPGVGLGLDPGTAYAIQTGPVNVQILPASHASVSTIQSQVAGTVLQTVSTSNPLLHEFVSNINDGSRIVLVAGADALSVTNGAIIVPLLGTPGNVLAMGPSSTVGGQGGARQTSTARGDFKCSTGLNTDVVIDAAAGRNNTTLPAQSADTLLHAVTTNAGGNGVSLGALTILNGGGHNIISQDGNGLVSEKGNGLTGQTVTGVISNDGGTFAAGLSHAAALTTGGKSPISDAGGNLAAKGLVISNDGGTFVSTLGGNAVHAAGTNGIIGENSSGILGENGSGLVGTADNTAGLSATAGGCLHQVGSTSGIISQDGNGLLPTTAVSPRSFDKAPSRR